MKNYLPMYYGWQECLETHTYLSACTNHMASILRALSENDLALG